jgi:hypothetical protein
MERRLVVPMLVLGVAVAGTVAATVAGCQAHLPAQKFTDEEVARLQGMLAERDFNAGRVALIKAELKKLAPEHYRVVLPVYRRTEPPPAGDASGRAMVSTETLGKMPITEVRRMASLRKIPFNEASNAQAVIFQDTQGDTGGAPTTQGDAGGAPTTNPQGGCEGDHQTPAHGIDVAARINEILANIDHSKYVFLY